MAGVGKLDTLIAGIETHTALLREILSVLRHACEALEEQEQESESDTTADVQASEDELQEELPEAMETVEIRERRPVLEETKTGGEIRREQHLVQHVPNNVSGYRGFAMGREPERRDLFPAADRAPDNSSSADRMG